MRYEVLGFARLVGPVLEQARSSPGGAEGAKLIGTDGILAVFVAGVALVVAVLLFRRLPTLLVLNPLLDRVRGTRDALFLEWFGPIGVAALYYANLARRETGAEAAWVVSSLIVCVSVLAHGVTPTPFTKLYGGRTRSGE